MAAYSANGLLGKGMSSVCLKSIVLCRTEVVHEDSMEGH